MLVEEKENEVKIDNIEDIDIADEASKLLAEKNKRISQLEKELAISKLHSSVEEEVVELRTADDCIKDIFNPNINQYDYAVAVCDLYDVEEREGLQHSLGEYADEVVELFKSVIEDCDGDKSNFVSLYQARIGKDDKASTLAYNKSKIK